MDISRDLARVHVHRYVGTQRSSGGGGRTRGLDRGVRPRPTWNPVARRREGGGPHRGRTRTWAAVLWANKHNDQEALLVPLIQELAAREIALSFLVFRGARLSFREVKPSTIRQVA
jgi:hypothetical protein